VLEARCGVQIGGNDVYLNVAGGLRIAEPAADLAVAAALVSALSLRPVPAETVIFGEIGLSGEVRPVGQAEARLKEAGKLGFTTALVPPLRGRAKEREPTGGVTRREIRHLRDLVEPFERGEPRRAARSFGTPGAPR
jgi:DNA repair protein RadA/Sms